MRAKKKLTVKELQQCIYSLYKAKGYKWFSLNTFGVGEFEADFIAIHPENLFAVEFEIKRSRSDFLADFKKKNKHDLLKKGKWPINQFYFVAERGVLNIKQIPYHLGLITVEKIPYYKEFKKGAIIKKRKEYKYDIAIEKKAKVLHNEGFPDHLMINILTSVMHKYFENFNRGVIVDDDKQQTTTFGIYS